MLHIQSILQNQFDNYFILSYDNSFSAIKGCLKLHSWNIAMRCGLVQVGFEIVVLAMSFSSYIWYSHKLLNNLF